MFVKGSCEHCQGNIEFDNAHLGMSVKCPHCFVPTRLVVAASPSPQSMLEESTAQATSKGYEVPPRTWEDRPMTEKQKAMFVLYDIAIKDGFTRGEASELIDEAKESGVIPSEANQAKADRLFRKIEFDAAKQQLKDLCETFSSIAKKVMQGKITSAEIEELKSEFQDASTDFADILQDRFDAVDTEECERENRRLEREELGE